MGNQESSDKENVVNTSQIETNKKKKKGKTTKKNQESSVKENMVDMPQVKIQENQEGKKASDNQESSDKENLVGTAQIKTNKKKKGKKGSDNQKSFDKENDVDEPLIESNKKKKKGEKRKIVEEEGVQEVVQAKSPNLDDSQMEVMLNPTSKEERKLQKKQIRKQKREEMKANGEVKDKKPKLTTEEKPKVVGKKKKKKIVNGLVKEEQKEGVPEQDGKKKDKGKRFDIGRVIHSFLDACPLKKASFADVTNKVLAELKVVKPEPAMAEDQLIKKINKKIEFNPNINIKNGEIILV